MIRVDQRCPTHSPHVVNGHVNVANDFSSKCLKIGLFWNKQNKNKIFLFNSHLKTPKNLKRDGPGCKICQKT